jgi:hypothetical protein
MEQSNGLEKVNRFSNQFTRLVQRWDNRMSVHGESFSKQYAEGRLTVLAQLQFPKVHGSPSCAGEFSDFWRTDSADDSARFIYHVGASRAHTYNWDKQLMFVSNIQTVNGVQGVIPSFMGFYRLQKNLGYGGGPVAFYSLRNSLLKSFPGAVHGEVIINISDDLAKHELQSGAQIVNGVSADKRPIRRDGLEQSVSKDFSLPEGIKQAILGLSTFLNSQSVEIRIEERFNGALQIADVLIGPVDF